MVSCLYPVKIPIKEDNKIVAWQEVPCGHCYACQENYKKEWAVRVKHELDSAKGSVFVTLTYNDVHLSLQNLEYDDGTKNSLQKHELSDFIKRLRRRLEPKKIRFFGCGEYGDEVNYTGRPHYHILFFGLKPEDPIFKNKIPVYRHGKVDHYYIEHWDVWPHGQVEISAQEPDAQSAQYITKYVAKKKGISDEDHYKLRKIHPEFLLMSRNPGIGYNGIKEHAKYYATHPYGVIKGYKTKLPRYVVDKVGEILDIDYREMIACDQLKREKMTFEQIKMLERKYEKNQKI